MSMSIPELERSLRALRLSGMIATLQTRSQQVAHQQMNFIEAFSWLVQDELDRHRSRLLERRCQDCRSARTSATSTGTTIPNSPSAISWS